MFTSLSPEQTGITFSNNITENDDDPSIIHEFSYMGGGVGIGDFNNDGLKDIVFTGNQVSSRLYINKGNDEFRDITKEAGLTTHVWATGISVADINNDGYDDIYICVYGGRNLLFINQHNLTFKEEAAAYGLADSSCSTQAVFLDYDKDGRTDMFLTNYRRKGPNPNDLHRKDKSGNSPANDKLYRNVGDRGNPKHPFFVDVSTQAGIREDGYGLGVSVSDFNHDGWPDIYVSNDYLSNDELWMNNKDGTFTNCIGKSLRHQSYSGMGVVAVDLNNDLLPDIVTLDMEPENNERKKLSYTFMNYDRYEKERALGYQPEFMRNMLHLNNGVRTFNGRPIPFFSEIGRYAGISATGWSWCILAADFDNDGWKDLAVTNGTGRDFINADFVHFSTTPPANPDDRDKRKKILDDKLKSLGRINLHNYLFLNKKDCSFKDVSHSSGIDQPDLSNGAAYVDIDNDGDLDLIVNNINRPASVFINNTINKKIPSKAHYLQVELTGPESNRDALGTRVFVYSEGISQVQEEYPVQGYLSTMDRKLHFGLDSLTRVDSVVVVWPDAEMNVIYDIPADTVLEVQYSNTGKLYHYKRNRIRRPALFSEVTDKENVHYKHLDVSFDDYKLEPLLPHKYSQMGPYIATADVNADGLADFFIGGGFNSSGALFIQKRQGGFYYVKFDTTIKFQEDTDCAFLDVDKDGDPDLLITYGGTRYAKNSIYYKPRLYINDGKGDFRLDRDAIPDNVRTIAGCLTVCDYDDDGYPDVFIGGRVSKMYPLAPRSYLLHNNKGKFADVTEQMCPALQKPGMVTSAVWADIDGDKRPDLVISGEWMPIRFFKNEGNRLEEVTQKTGLTRMNGLWRSLAACDIDGDGDMDLVAGNLGTDNKYHVTAQYPMKLFAGDIDHNGLIDPVMFYYIKDNSGTRRLYPAIKRDMLLKQVPSLGRVFRTNREYSRATFDDIFGRLNEDEVTELTCDETRSCYLENVGNGKFVKHILPRQAQFAPVNAIICEDFDGDGVTDLLLAGNDYQTEVRTGRYDASYGLFLKGTGNDNQRFETIPPITSGFIVDGEVRDMAVIRNAKNKKLILVAVNDDSLRVFGVR